MPLRITIRRNEYHDSILLMRVSEHLRALSGVRQAMVVMATASNRQILEELGMPLPEGTPVTESDMAVAIEAESETALEQAVASLDRALKEKSQRPAGQQVFPTLAAAVEATPDANLCVVTVPGAFAAGVLKQALRAGLHCVCYSDNVPLEQERAVKALASERGLLCMGPDCGAANVNGYALLTASVVRRGPVGVVGASGSGVQLITVLAEKAGLGISHAIGVGGKDAKDEIGGIGLLAGLDALEADPDTKVIVLVSRTPGSQTLPKLLERVTRLTKPKVVFFIGGDPEAIARTGAYAAADLEDAANAACDLARGIQPIRREFAQRESEIESMVHAESARMAPAQKYLRGLFCGGTFCEEAQGILKTKLGRILSNVPADPADRLKDSRVSQEHTVLDLGEEEFTLGRAHAAIDPAPIKQALLREGRDPQTAVILMDFILSHAVNPDPVGSILPELLEAKRLHAERGGYLSVVASVCGTDGDPQRLSEQERKLREAGALVLPSNAQASRVAGWIASLRA